MWKKLVGLTSSLLLAAALVPGAALADVPAGAAEGADVPAGAEAAGAASAPSGDAFAPIGSASFLQTQAVIADYSWYDPNAGSYTLTTPDQVLGFANLVNGLDGKGAVTFRDKTVSLQSATFNFQSLGWTPIGDAAHQFLGAFNGNGATVNNFTVSGSGRAAYLGFFGYVGVGGSVSNLKVGSGAKVEVTRDASSADVIHHVAGVVGFCGGTVSGCSNAASVKVESAVSQTISAAQPVFAVGGVAGECVFDMSGCSNSAAISVSASSDPVGEVDDSGLVHFVGGVVGILGDSARVGTLKAAVGADPTRHGALSNCSNTGKIEVNTPSEAGTDRFGATAFARSVCVGGVAGYSQGSVDKCTNGQIGTSLGSDVGYVRAEHATSAGGIVGSLRGLIGSDNPTTRSNRDDGMASTAPGHDALLLSNCTNYGDVYGLNAVGGIAGYAGTYTAIKGCVNSVKSAAGDTFVVATRWNKPAPAGIVGSTCGDVALCANLATVASGSWSDEAARTITQAAGYYAAGIAGMLSYYSDVNPTTQATEILSPVPEVYGCYNAGSIVAVSGMRQRGIVGENEGRVHHCALLQGTVEGDKISYGDNAADSEASGTVDNCETYAVSDMMGTAPIALMNAAASVAEYQRGFYWAKSSSTAAAGDLGYPVLPKSPAAPSSRTSISVGSATCETPAAYNGGSGDDAAIPGMKVTVGGTTLTANVDYYVVPQGDAVEVGSGYAATIVGIGSFAGSISGVPYSIAKGYLGDCVMTVTGATFNYNVQYPTMANITVKTANGVVIDQGEYEIVDLKDRNGDVTTTPTNRGNYTLTVRVKGDSAHFDAAARNTLSATYRISPADIMRVVDFSKVIVSYNGATYAWISSTDEEDADNPKTTIPFTGSVVNPTVSGLTYNGHALVEGVDYRIVYGNPNSGEGDTGSHDLNNMGKKGERTVGCVTVRFVTNSNFSNYVNMFFNIADDGTGTQEMYRLYNPNSGEHFYTANEEERDYLASIGWSYEGVGWTAPGESQSPVYRLYNSYGGEHHYTLSEDERDFLVGVGWTYENVGWYSDDAESVPVYRQYNPNALANNHNYTPNAEERDWLISLGWRDELIGWYGI